MGIAAHSVKRPVTVVILVAACLLFGFLSLDRIGLDLLPKMDLPMAAVVTIYHNADPETVESMVTVPVERALRSVRNIKYVTSMSMENVSIALAEFNWGTDLGTMQQEMRTNLDAVRYQLPEGAQAPIVSLIDLSQLPILALTVGVPGDIDDVTREVRDVVKPAIERVPGVAGVSISGGANRIVSVEYDHERLVEAGLSPLLLQQLIALQNLSVPGGVVVDDDVRYQTRVGSKFESADDVAELTIGLKKKDAQGNSGGLFGLPFLIPQFLTVGDVADVKETFEKAEGYVRVNGAPAVMVQVQKQSGENTVTAVRKVKEALDTLLAERPDLEIAYLLDQSAVITNSISNLTSSTILGAFLAVAVLWLFLRHVGSTLVIGISIPLSIVFTFVLMYASRLTLNLMTLGGLALGIGMLVDNSIVVLENIFRRQELGDSPIEAAVRGTGEVGMAITASTFTTVAVFIPVVFLQSLTGQIFKELALTVTFSLLASLVVAVTVVPLLASIVIRLGRERVKAGSGSEKTSGKLAQVYERLLISSQKHRWAVLGVTLAAFAVSIYAAPGLGLEFLKSIDMGRLDIRLTMSAGTPTNITDELSRRVESVLAEVDGFKTVVAEVGSTGSGDYMSIISGSTSNTSKITVGLETEGSDRVSATDAVRRARQAMEAILADYDDVECRIDASGLGSFGGENLDLMGQSATIEVQGNDPYAIAEYAATVTDRLREVPGFVEVNCEAQQVQPLMLLDVNRTRALMGGMTVGQVGLGVRTGMLGTTATYIERDGALIPVVVKPRSEGVPTLDSLLEMPITSSLSVSGMTDGASQMGSNASAAARTTSSMGSSLLAPATEVLVGRIATPRIIEGPITLTRRNGVRYTIIKIDFEGMKLSQATDLAVKVASELEAPEDVSLAVGGVSRVIDESFAELKLVGILAVILVYMVMAIQYESFLYPFIIMFTMPLAFVGAFALLAIAGESFSIMAIIGLIVLAGVVVNNGIVMVDFINQVRADGVPTHDAVMLASRARLRPILMTALTTILGLLPVAVAMGVGTEMERPLALAIIGGLTFATFLTLIVIPIIYELVDGLSSKFGRKGVR